MKRMIRGKQIILVRDEDVKLYETLKFKVIDEPPQRLKKNESPESEPKSKSEN